MNVRRFVGKNAREAMAQARAAYGEQAVVLGNRPVPGGVEILAMPSADVPGRTATGPGALAALPAPARSTESGRKPAAAPAGPMSTLSFQDFVRERQRQDARASQPEPQPQPQPQPKPAPATPRAAARAPVEYAAASAAPVAQPQAPVEPGRFARQALRKEAAAAGPDSELLAEVKEMRAMLSGQLANLSWFDSVRRSPAQTRLLRLMMGNGFSPALARHVVQRLPADLGEGAADAWLAEVLARNLRESEAGGIQQNGGVFAVVGPTGVGKTTTTAKIAARFAMQHGASSVGLITVDTYRMAGADQLSAYGRILRIPVHTARDSASLLDLLDLFSGKKLVLVDTVGVSQRDRRIHELFSALPADRISRLLVLNAGAQGETLDEVVRAYTGGPGTRCVISKLDEAARCGAALDVAIRHQLVLEGFANGQRVPEDWHPARAQLLVQKALLKPVSATYMPDDAELGLLLTAPPARLQARGAARA